MTYAFGAYVDPQSGKVRTDLDWIKSDQKVRGKKGHIKRDFKSSYKKLADVFGLPFSTAVNRSVALAAADFGTDQIVENACKNVLSFQADLLRDVFRRDPETAAFADELPAPAALLAPYFYIEQSRTAEWVALNRRLALVSTKLVRDIPVHVVICGHRDLLTNAVQSQAIISNLKECKPAGVWLWFSRFDEHGASRQELAALRHWVEQLSPQMPVFNMHGSYFSLALSKVGMAGIAHGVGYGEQKDVVPVIGQSTPTVQYYVRSLHAKYSVPQITRCFSALGVTTPEQFFEIICDCVICKGIIGKDLNAFAQFGEIHYSRPSSKRASQTPAAAKRCRYHFLLNRSRERDYVRANALKAIADNCNAAADQWRKTILGQSIGHLRTWAEVLS
jgi:predicted esterase